MIRSIRLQWRAGLAPADFFGFLAGMIGQILCRIVRRSRETAGNDIIAVAIPEFWNDALLWRQVWLRAARLSRKLLAS